MFLDANPCAETVSILEAIVFGAGGACIDIGMTSLLGAVAGFVVCVLLIRYVAMQVLRQVFPGLRRTGARKVAMPAEPQDTGLQPLPYESPIRSNGAWGGERR